MGLNLDQKCIKCGAKSVLNDRCLTCGALQSEEKFQEQKGQHIAGNTGLIIAISMLCDPQDKPEIVRKVRQSLQYLIDIGFIANVKVESELLTEEKTKELGIINGSN